MGLHRDLNSLLPEFKGYIEEAFKKFEEKGMHVLISETLRDENVQVAYYAQGRKPLDEVNKLRKEAGLWAITEAENKRIITKCDGIVKKSKHQTRDNSNLGRAIDLVPGKLLPSGSYTFNWNASMDEYKAIAEVLTEVSKGKIDSGVYWPGDFKDAPHHELK